MARKAITYAEAGVDIDAADEFVAYIRTRKPAIGGFSGLFRLPSLRSMRRPMLVGSTDGVGTKLLIAKALGRFDTIGIDLVAMVVNDLITCGAIPLFFLDYYATGKLNLNEAKAVFDGILAGCEEAGMEMLGGETAELPGLYAKGDFDLAGFGVGLVDGERVIDGRTIRPGDLVFGFESTGLHSNGYSLARKVLLEHGGMKLSTRVRELGQSLGEVLLTPTRIYARLVEALR
ncbi:MAG: phosphoribosylformylglycinamidine cyclo-ligase, partial [Candidatus Sumerlaeaceae bacterium]|nr:phosphoribosylformylglycinamidine cyclo-ligase [Candidatus Sumerlaeaceae bacterium]